MQKKQVTSVKILYFEKHRNSIVCDQQYAFLQQIALLASLDFPKAVCGVWFQVTSCRNKPVPTTLLHFFCRYEVSCQEIGSEMEMDVLLKMLM